MLVYLYLPEGGHSRDEVAEDGLIGRRDEVVREAKIGEAMHVVDARSLSDDLVEARLAASATAELESVLTGITDLSRLSRQNGLLDEFDGG